MPKAITRSPGEIYEVMTCLGDAAAILGTDTTDGMGVRAAWNATESKAGDTRRFEP